MRIKIVPQPNPTEQVFVEIKHHYKLQKVGDLTQVIQSVRIVQAEAEAWNVRAFRREEFPT
ncbi:MAG TPA: hypothetical protein PKU78_06790 [Candidatus Dojkabacteria bacterium]|nr:hypothetical protein [Candidatus Dojkabacteria bacterium]